MLFMVLLVVLVVDNSHDPSHHFLTPAGQKHYHIAVPEGFILPGIEECPFIRVYGRDPVGMVLMDLCR
jgi:hypothetical protein